MMIRQYKLKSKGMTSNDMTNSAIYGRDTDYLPKYFTSRKVNINNDMV
jgi:hypothetical protein